MTRHKTPHRKKRAFLLAFGQLGSIKAAAEQVGIDRGTHYDWMREPAYAADFAEAQLRAARELEDEAVRRATATVGGSDTLLIFLLKCRNPAVFGDKHRLEHSGPSGGPIKVSLDEWDQFLKS